MPAIDIEVRWPQAERAVAPRQRLERLDGGRPRPTGDIDEDNVGGDRTVQSPIAARPAAKPLRQRVVVGQARSTPAIGRRMPGPPPPQCPASAHAAPPAIFARSARRSTRDPSQRDLDRRAQPRARRPTGCRNVVVAIMRIAPGVCRWHCALVAAVEESRAIQDGRPGRATWLGVRLGHVGLRHQTWAVPGVPSTSRRVDRHGLRRLDGRSMSASPHPAVFRQCASGTLRLHAAEQC